MKITTFIITILALFSPSLSAEFKADKDISYGPHERNAWTLYWNTKFKNVPSSSPFTAEGSRTGARPIATRT